MSEKDEDSAIRKKLFCMEKGNLLHELSHHELLLPFLANVNVSSRSLYAIARPSVVCLSATLVRPTPAVQFFGNISTVLGTLAIR